MFELLLSSLWQCLHQALHRLDIARWFVNRAGGFAADGATRKAIATCRKECAIAYHQLHQVHFFVSINWFLPYLIRSFHQVHLCTEERDHLLGFFMAMSAVNLAEASGVHVPSNLRAHTYALLSLRIRHSLPRGPFRFLARFYMFKARHRHRRNENTDANLGWLLTSKEGQKFMSTSDWEFGQECSQMVKAF